MPRWVTYSAARARRAAWRASRNTRGVRQRRVSRGGGVTRASRQLGRKSAREVWERTEAASSRLRGEARRARCASPSVWSPIWTLMDPVSCVSCVSPWCCGNAAETHETIHWKSGMRYHPLIGRSQLGFGFVVARRGPGEPLFGPLPILFLNRTLKDLEVQAACCPAAMARGNR